MRFINGWNYMFKDVDRFEIKVRISVVTLFEAVLDLSSKTARITILNLGIEIQG